MDTIQWTALGLSLPHEVGTVGMVKILPALGPALVFQDQVRGWEQTYERTEHGTAGGANRALKVPLGKAW